jgi:glycosyltransferase involved in cell wall biosynthesis
MAAAGAKPPPTALLVLPWSPDHVGGVSEVVINLHRQLAARDGLQPLLLIDTYKRHAVASIETRALGRVDSFYLPAPAGPGKGLRHLLAFLRHAPGAAIRFARYLRREQVDVINIHFPSLSLVTVLIARWIADRPVRVVASFHGSDLTIAAAGGALQRLLWRLAVAGCDAVVACSHRFAGEVAQQFPNAVGRLHVIHNGVDVAACRSAARSARLPPELEGRPFIVCVATFETKKAQDVLLDAFARMAHAYPELCLVLAGAWGPTLAALQERAAGQSFSRRVLFYTDVPHDRTLALIAGARLLVLPSRQEPFGIVVLEAASLRVPVVATCVGGLPEIIEDGRSGVLIRPDDADALMAAIVGLLDDRAAAAAHAEALLQDAEARFSWRQAAEKYGALLVPPPRADP